MSERKQFLRIQRISLQPSERENTTFILVSATQTEAVLFSQFAKICLWVKVIKLLQREPPILLLPSIRTVILAILELITCNYFQELF